jgi:hypothetical protein
MERIMTIRQVSTKIDLRLNKSASGDFDNIWSYAKQEAFQKAVNEWVRRQIHGKNLTQEGAEETTMRVDDLQVLLKTENLSVRDKGIFSQSEKLPVDYFYHKRVTPIVSKGKCSNVQIVSKLKEEANVDVLKTLPSFNFEQTYHTLINNKIHIYHNKDFEIQKIILTYYRKPKVYNFKKLDDEVEFKDDICEILVDEAVKIISSDIESLNQKNLAQEREQINN